MVWYHVLFECNLNATEYIPTNKNTLCDNRKLSNRKNPCHVGMLADCKVYITGVK